MVARLGKDGGVEASAYSKISSVTKPSLLAAEAEDDERDDALANGPPRHRPSPGGRDPPGSPKTLPRKASTASPEDDSPVPHRDDDGKMPPSSVTSTSSPQAIVGKIGAYVAKFLPWRQEYVTWRQERQRAIDALNARVEKLTAEAVANAKVTGKPLTTEYEYALGPMTPFRAGTPVYHMRSAVLVHVYALFGVVLVALGMAVVSPLASALAVVLVFFEYDLHSGILHIVLDHPDNTPLPYIGQPCLEFQWHHLIPDDLVRKDFVDTCGDLNVVIPILFIINFYLFDAPFKQAVGVYHALSAFLRDGVTPDLSFLPGIPMVVGGTKIFMGFFGQYSHRASHSVGSMRSPVMDWLERRGLVMSARDHYVHHKPPHDRDFCLIGFCNPIMHAMRAVTTNNVLWMVFFLVFSSLDIFATSKFVEWAVNSISARSAS